jgi:hypothetical protein
MLNQNDQAVVHDKGKVIYLVHEKDILKGVYGYGHIGGEGYAFEGAIKLPQGIEVAEKQGKNAVFVVSVYGHTVL